MATVPSLWLGLTPYESALQTQRQQKEKILAGNEGCVFGCEHPEVITLGKRLQGKETLSTPIKTIQSDRGGLATAHNPGQLVIYPVLSLKNHDLRLRQWVELLLKTTELLLKECNIILDIHNQGVFTKNGKIASLGIHVSKGISTHGVAINVSNDLRLFAQIAPCGVVGQTMDRVFNYDNLRSSKDLFAMWCEIFNARLTSLH